MQSFDRIQWLNYLMKSDSDKIQNDPIFRNFIFQYN